MSVEASNERELANPQSEPPTGEVESQRFPIVGIGASAGGLAAFEAFFSGMPAHSDSGMAFVLVQHLAPDHESILVELVKRYTRMQVFEVEDGMRVLPNCAYIIPPNRDMALLNGTLHLLEPTAQRGQRLSVDFFFRSLAHDQRERAMCVVLSGSGSDGSQGVRAIKAEGGMAMAQNPDSTEYDGMPRSAIGTGLIDYILPPAEMPTQLIAYAAYALDRRAVRNPEPVAKADDVLKKIFVLLRAHTGHDFSQYKQNTVGRRVERRMAVHQLELTDQYLRYLQETPAEIESLFRDLLIGVTSFFRDKEVFESLQQQLGSVLAAKAADSSFRVWTTGCSTGEEAYSLAILLREQMDALKKTFKVQVFATDIDSRAIDTARAGVYPASIATDVSPERLARFFSVEDGGYRIHKNIRDLLVFSEHDVIKDPPFSKLDLVSCRNLLIYMGPELQRKLIPLFHYALNPGGLLLLGSSETVGDFAELFSPLERKAKLYRWQGDDRAFKPSSFGRFLPRTSDGSASSSHARQSARASGLPLRELTERTLLSRAPVAALVNEQGDLLYLHGQTGKFLEPSPGEAGLSILKMARQGLRPDLASALRRAAVQNERVICTNVRVKTNGDFTTIDLSVEPVVPDKPSADASRLFLVSFEALSGADHAPAPRTSNAAATEPSSDAERQIVRLTQELRAKDEHLVSTHEAMQTANEELRSSNEELQSTNEELQSTNEELETSKEELQSVNEELATVNSELQAKVADLSRANNDMNNLLAGTGVGTVFVDHQLFIQRFTPAVTQLINLIRSDIGRPLAHIVNNLQGYDRLVLDIQDVLDTLIPKEVEVQTHAGAWHLLRIRPYRTLENVIEGAVITFMEVTEQRRAQAVLLEHESLRRMAAVMRDAGDAITVQALDGRILAWNQTAVRRYGYSEPEALAMNIQRLFPNDQREAALAVIARLVRAEVLEPYRTERLTKDGRVIAISLIATALSNESGQVYAVSTIEREAKGDADGRQT
jgi:two-component system, chemotaxis family, CheB/CheR fusion protein